MKKTVLVLEDDENKRKDLERELTYHNYTVYPVDCIESATKIIQAEEIDFALIDLRLNFKDDYGGKTMIKILNKQKPRTKIIIVTGYELTDELRKELSDVEYFGFVSRTDAQNYLKLVIKTLKEAQERAEPKKCFVIMPFSSTKSCTSAQWEHIFDNIIKPAVERAGFNYICEKSKLRIGHIIIDILDNLNAADVVIADLTDWNPNVFYELGVRHALRDSTVLITQSIKKAPFDLRPYAMIEYDWTTDDGKKQFFKDIHDVFQEIEKGGKNVSSPVRDYLKLIPVPD
jgi:CheY-like chemotaxis protein